MDEDPFDYSDIEPLNINPKFLQTEFEKIYKMTENTTLDWRKREISLRRMGAICIGNQGKSEQFIKFINGQLQSNLDKQLADLRSSVMKEACRMISLCAKELGTLLENFCLHIMTQYVLFKIAGNQNRVISDNSSKCILNIVRYVHSYKIINNICEQKILKSNVARCVCAQCLLYIMCSYQNVIMLKSINIILESLKILLSDPNGEVRAMSRKVFIAYKKRFETEAINFFSDLEKNVQKQIIEDEKNIGDSIIINIVENVETPKKNKVNLLYGSNSGNKPKSNEVKYNMDINFNNEDINEKNNSSEKKLPMVSEFQENKSRLKNSVKNNSVKSNEKKPISNKEVLERLNNKYGINNMEQQVEKKMEKKEIKEDIKIKKKSPAKPLAKKNIDNNNINKNTNKNISNNNNINNNKSIKITTMEEKIILLLKKLNMTNSMNDKLLVFQYLFNDFNQILNEINNISDNTRRKFVDTHIEYLSESDKLLVEQIIKNLMRMIFYLNQIFNDSDMESIVKSLLENINKNADKNLSKLSHELLEIIRKKYNNEKIFNTLYIQLNDEKSDIDNDICYTYLSVLVPSCSNIFYNRENFKKIFCTLCKAPENSKKIGNLLDSIYKAYPDNFLIVFREENEKNQRKILSIMQKNNSLYYQEIINKIKIINEKNNSKNNSLSNLNQQNNYNNNTNNQDDENVIQVSNDILECLETGDLERFLNYISANINEIPSFLLLLSDSQYNDNKYVKNIINFTYSLLSNDTFIREIEISLDLFINQIIHLLLTNIKNNVVIDTTKEIMNILPFKVNIEKFFRAINIYLNIKNEVILLQILLTSIKNFVMNNKSKNLESLLPLFIDGVLNLLNHPLSEIRKLAVYCCVEIYMVVGYKFDVYFEMLPKSQQNLINLFIKKRTG